VNEEQKEKPCAQQGFEMGQACLARKALGSFLVSFFVVLCHKVVDLRELPGVNLMIASWWKL